MRPMLRPGLRLLTTPAGHPALVEHDRAHRLDAGTARLLARVDGLTTVPAILEDCSGGDPADGPTAWVWRRLCSTGVVVDAEAPTRMARTRTRGPVPLSRLREATAALATDPADADERWARRGDARVAVTGEGRLREPLLSLLRECGIGGVGEAAGLPDPTMTLLLDDHEPALDTLEQLMRASRPHLVAGLRGPEAVVGPLVVPGHTPCLRCVDLVRAEADPMWGSLREQLSRPGDGGSTTDAASAVVVSAAAALAASDVLALVEGTAPATSGATATLSLRAPLPRLRAWPRHPLCGCGWQAGFAPR